MKIKEATREWPIRRLIDIKGTLDAIPGLIEQKPELVGDHLDEFLYLIGYNAQIFSEKLVSYRHSMDRITMQYGSYQPDGSWVVDKSNKDQMMAYMERCVNLEQTEIPVAYGTVSASEFKEFNIHVALRSRLWFLINPDEM